MSDTFSRHGKVLEGRTALITGGSRGIGAAIATTFAANGARIFITYLREREKATQVIEGIRDAGGQAWSLQADLRSERSLRDCFAQFGTYGFGLDILVNNAATFMWATLEETDVVSFDELIATNLRGALLTTTLAVPYMRRHSGQHGRVINISSTAAQASVKGSAAYAATKAGIEALTRVHAAELAAYGVTVNAIAPGPTRTEMMESTLDEQSRADVCRRTMLGRLGDMQDIANVAMFLASPQSGWITGEVMRAAGGLR